jgi:hypothetical protein
VKRLRTTAARRLGLLILVGLGLAPADDDPARLVERLGSGRFEERERAARELERLGAPALPALRRARGAADPEVRGRAAGLVERIAFAQVLAPTLVRLDFPDRPLRELVATLAGRSGIPIVLDPRGGDGLAARAVTLEAPEPVPFWEAVGRLAEAAHLRPDLRPLPDPDTGAARSTLVLEEAGDRLAPAAAWGPFRVKLLDLEDRRVRALDPPARPLGEAPARPERTLTGRLHLSAEPRLAVGPGGRLRLTVARDDLGRSFLPDAPAADAADDPGPPRAVEYTGTPELVVPFALAPPEGGPGRRLTLEGTLPVGVAARAEAPLEIPLAGAVGKAFEGDDATLTVEAVGPRPEDGRTTIDLAVRPRATPAADPDAAPAAASGLVDTQVEVRDAAGRLLPAFLGRAEADGAALRVRVVLVPTPDAGPPSRLLYFSLRRGLVAVPFAFRDVPLP